MQVWQSGGVDCLLQLLGRGGQAAAGQQVSVLAALAALVSRNEPCKHTVVEGGGLLLLAEVSVGVHIYVCELFGGGGEGEGVGGGWGDLHVLWLW